MQFDMTTTDVRRVARQAGISRHFARLLPLAGLLLAFGLRAQAPPSAPQPAAAPAPQPPVTDAPAPVQHIAKINIRGAQRLGKDLLAGLLPFKEGDVYDEQKVRDNFQDLLKKDPHLEMHTRGG